MFAFISRFFKTEIDRLKSENQVLRQDLLQAEVGNAKLRAEIDFYKEQTARADRFAEAMQNRNKELLDDLLIATGVKTTAFQEELMRKNLGSQDVAYRSQGSSWATDMQSEVNRENWDEKKKESIRLMQELESEFGIKEAS